MKYLRHYKIFENKIDAELIYNNLINWELINDLKDMALEYIDNGCELNYEIDIYYFHVRVNSQDYVLRTLANGSFDHENDICDINEYTKREFIPSINRINKLSEFSSPKISDIPKNGISQISYNFNLVVPDQFRYKGYETDLLKRIRSAYPDEKISTYSDKY